VVIKIKIMVVNSNNNNIKEDKQEDVKEIAQILVFPMAFSSSTKKKLPMTSTTKTIEEI
jgi:hypothetical protein